MLFPFPSGWMGKEGEMRLKRQADFQAKEMGLYPTDKRQQIGRELRGHRITREGMPCLKVCKFKCKVYCWANTREPFVGPANKGELVTVFILLF